MDERLRVLICDDHTIMRAGLLRILGEDPDITVVADVGTMTEAVSVAGRELPDVVIMDLTLPDGSGIAAIEAILTVSPTTRALVLTMHDDVAYLAQAFAVGAVGYVVKAAADTELLRAVREVGAGLSYVHPAMGAALLQARGQERPTDAAVAGLSEREAEILRLLALGYTNPEMAELLTISVRTVETYRHRLQQKVGLRTRAELARLARDYGLVR